MSFVSTKPTSLNTYFVIPTIFIIENPEVGESSRTKSQISYFDIVTPTNPVLKSKSWLILSNVTEPCAKENEVVT